MKEDSAKMDNPEREKKLMDVLKSAQVIALTRMFSKSYCHPTSSVVDTSPYWFWKAKKKSPTEKEEVKKCFVLK